MNLATYRSATSSCATDVYIGRVVNPTSARRDHCTLHKSSDKAFAWYSSHAGALRVSDV